MGAPGSDKAIAAIMKWSENEDWKERWATVFGDHVGPVLDDFEMTIDEVIEILEPEAFAPLMWCALEDFITCDFEPDARNVVDDYLKRRGWKESAPVKVYLRALRSSVMSAYEVVETRPGSHFVVRDLIRGGAPIRVEDKLGSQDLAQWDRIAARLLPIKGRFYLSAGVLWLSFDEAAEVVEEIGNLERKLRSKIKRALKAEGVTEIDLKGLPTAEAILGEMAPWFTQTWLTTMLERLVEEEKSLPELRNFESDPVQLCETRLPVLEPDSLEQVTARLDALDDLERETEGAGWTWLAADAPYADDHGRSEPASGTPGLAEGGQQLLGWVRLDADALVLETNSVARAKRGRDLLVAALEPLVGTPLTSIKSPAQALAEPSTEPPQEAQLSLSLEEQNEALSHVLDRHYRATLNAPVPALDGKTPKQAVRSKAGREKAARWLKYLENQTAHRAKASDLPDYDFGWMWEALNIKDLRR